jgi:AAA domain
MLLDLQHMARALGGEVRNGQVLCPGPSHSPKDRSLSVKLDPHAPDGFLVNSFSTDDPIQCKDYVRQKLGLSAFNPNGGKDRPRRSEAELEAALLATINQQPAPPRNIVQSYYYNDEKGEPLYEVVRLEPKDFRQRRPNGNGGWTWNLGDVRRVPYRLPELLQYPDATVFVCEGEKDADRVAGLGHCATTAASSKWTDDCIAVLRGRDVIILEDNDEPGRKKAHDLAEALHGVAATIRIIHLSDLPEGGDVSDWLDADPHRAEKFAETCFAAPRWAPDTRQPQPSSWHYHDEKPAAPTAWLIKNILPETGSGLVSGQWGTYKTTAALDISHSIMTATLFAGRFVVRRPGGVIYFAPEGAGGLKSRLNAIAKERGTTGSLLFAWRSDCPPADGAWRARQARGPSR